MSVPVSFPAKTSIPKQRSDVIQGNGNTGKIEKLKLMIEKLTKEKIKEYLKSNQHLTQNAKLVNQQNKILKDAINDRTLFYEQILDKYSRSIRTLQTATDNNKKMSKIYKEYKSKLNNSQKSNDDSIFNPEICKIDREIKNIQTSANNLIKKFHKSEMKFFNYRVLFSLDTKLDQINKIFINEAKNCISANPCFFSNSRLDKLQQKIKKGDEIKKELFEEEKSEETKYTLKNISEKFDRCLSIYNQILLIIKKRKLMNEDDLEGLSKTDGFSYEKVESKVQKNIGYDDEISELKKIVEHSGFDYLNDPEREENFKKIRSLFIPGFNSSIYKSTESTESYDSEKENNDEKLPDSSDESESEDEEEKLLLYDQKRNKYVSVKVDDSNVKKENVGMNSNVESGSQQKLKQIYLPIIPIFQQPTFKQNSPRIHQIKNTNQKEKSSEQINIKEDKTSEEENIKESQSHEEINIKDENVKEEKSHEEINLKEEEQSSEEINVENEQSNEEENIEEEEQSSESQMYSSEFDQKETEKSDSAFDCILNRQENHSENSFLSGCLEISSSSEDPFYSSRTENENQIIMYEKSEDESDSLIEDNYLSERAFLTDKFHLSDEQNKKSSQDEKIEPLIPIIKTPFSFMFGPYKFEHSSEFVLEELDDQLEEELEKEKINIQLEELEKEKINMQLEELEKEELEKELYSKTLEPPKLKVKKPNSLLIRPNKSRQRSFIKSSQKKSNEDSDFLLENSHENDLHSVTSSDVFVLSSSQQSTKSEEAIEPLIPGRKLEKSISFLYSKYDDEDDSNVEFILEEPESESEKTKEKQEIEEDNKNQDVIQPLKTKCIQKKKQRVSTYDPSIFYPTSTIYPRTKFDYFPRSNEKVPLTVSLKDIGLEGFDSCKIEKMKELQRLQKVRKEEQKIKSKPRIVVDDRNHDKNYSFSTNSEVVCKLSIYGKSSSQRKERISSLNRKKMDKIEPYVDSNHMPTSLLNSTQKAQKVHAIKPRTVPKTCSRINKSNSSVVDGNQLNSLVCRSPRRYNEVKND